MINQFKNSVQGGKALIILGGISSQKWMEVREDINPDILLGANGVNSMIPHLDVWMCIENMRRSSRLARKGDPNAVQFMNMFQRTGPAIRIVHRKSFALLHDKEKAIPATKAPSFDADKIPENFSFRDYGQGYIKGALMKNKETIGDLKLAVGTVGLQLIHHAGILGCSEIHTIGFDLCFKEKDHHSYPYPAYAPNTYFKPENFIEYHGLKTMTFWLEGAQYLLDMKPQMLKDGIVWIDHSNGLLQVLDYNRLVSSSGESPNK